MIDCDHGDDPNLCPPCVGKRFPPTASDRNPSLYDEHARAEAAAPKPSRTGPDVDVPAPEPNT